MGSLRVGREVGKLGCLTGSLACWKARRPWDLLAPDACFPPSQPQHFREQPH